MDIQETHNNEASNNSQTIALLTWVATIFFSFIAPLVVYLVKKDDHFISAHAKGALNLSLIILIIHLLTLPIGWIFFCGSRDSSHAIAFSSTHSMANNSLYRRGREMLEWQRI